MNGTRRPSSPSPLSLGLALGLALALGCGSSGSGSGPIVFGGEGNRLNAYAPERGNRKQIVVERRSLDPNGWDLNGQICFDPDGSRRFIAGEDTHQPDPPPGWGYFQLAGERVGELSARRIGKLTPTYQASASNSENYGCGFLSDGRLVTSDVGDQASGPANGQLILWFPPFDRFDVPFCKLDVEIGTAGGIWIDDRDRIYLASARVKPGIYRYTGPFPTSADAAGGCGRRDATGAPLADAVERELFIRASSEIPTPGAIIGSGSGGFFISSIINGVIAEFDAGGVFRRRVLSPPPGEKLGAVPFSTGTPFGLGRDSRGTLYYADLGVVIAADGIGPGPALGTVRRIRFRGGEPLAPETIADGLDFPDGIGVLE